MPLCDSGCCGTYNTTEKTVERLPDPIFMDLDGCNNRKCYVGVHGTEFKFGMPVKPTTNPLEVEPSLDGSDAIGLVICNKISIPSNDSVTVIRTGRSLCWTDIAANIGKDPASMDDWWEFHIAMAKLNIYVEFN